MSLVVVDGQKDKIVAVPHFIRQNSHWVSSIYFRVEFAARVLHKDLHPQKSLVVKSAVQCPPGLWTVKTSSLSLQDSSKYGFENHTDTSTDQFSAAISHHPKFPSVPCEACSDFFADNDQLSQHFVSESFVFQEGVQTVRFLCETFVLSSALTLVCKAYVETQSQKINK